MKVTDFVAHETPVMAVPASAPPSSLSGSGGASNKSKEPAAVPVEIEPPEVDLDEILESTRRGSAVFGKVAGAFSGLSSSGQAILRFCGALDEHLEGKRAWILAAAIGLAGATSALEAAFEDVNPVWSVLTGNLLLLVVWFLAFSFAGSLRDENGIWRGGLIFGRFAATGRALWAEVASFGEAPLHIRHRTLALLFAVLSLATFAVGNLTALLLRAFGDSAPDLLSEIAGWGWLGAFFSGLFGVLWHRSRPARRVVRALETGFARELTGDLPPIIALGDDSLPSGDTFVHEIIDVLAQWKPRIWPSEKDYQFALQRHLERLMPDIEIEREKRLGPSRAEGIADFVLGESVILELKRGFRSKGSVDRAIGQMYAYAKQCPDMPSLLVIFEANLEDVMESLATSRLEDLHQRQATVTVRMPVPAKYEGRL
jgi:hypothetical protein